MDATLPFDSIVQLRSALVKVVPHLGDINVVRENDWNPEKAGKLGKADFRNAVTDFYLTNPIARASEVMAELSAGVKSRRDGAMAAE